MLYDEKGNPVDGAMTREEAQAQVAEKESAVAALQKQIEEFSGSDKGKNMAALREAKEKAEKELGEIKGNVVSQLGDMRKQMEDRELDATVMKIAEGNAELAKAIRESFTSIVKDTDTPEQRQKKMGDAYRLAVGSGASPDVLRSITSGAGAPPPNMNANAGTWPQPLVELAAKFGLTPDDLKSKNYNNAKN